MEPIRVRNLLSNMDALSRASMKKLLPKIALPDTTTVRYPSALLGILPKDDSYSLLGFIAEEMLRFSANDIHIDNLLVAIKKWYSDVKPVDIAKVQKSKTTKPFLDSLTKTRLQMDSILKGTLVFDTTVSFGSIEGHPDAQTDTQLFEVKMTGQLKKNWINFLYQVFAYAAIHEQAKEVYLVLPMQEYVWQFDLSKWESQKRTQFRDLLQNTAAKRQSIPSEENVGIHSAQAIQIAYNIGNHMQKLKSLTDTIKIFSELSRPSQIFLGSSLSAKMHIKDEELAESAKEMAKTTLKLFVHSPYIINLCADPGEKNDFAVNLLIKNLQYASIVGCKGVVVHVGKSTTKDIVVARTNMRTNLSKALEYATPECPILLETPAGQGTEMLTTYEDFTGFVSDFNDPRIGICIDTCHVFACGHNPLQYITRTTTDYPTLLKLVHYNDSATPCGSCLDRHAYFGTGHIGMSNMMDIANYCKDHDYPMVIE